MTEIWKPVPQLADKYEVSTLGRVAYVKNGARRLRKSKGQGQGYHLLSFHQGGRKISMRVHRMVAEAFVPNPERAPTVNHIDGNKDNNRADNLEWTSQTANNRHAVETGLCVKARGEQINTARLRTEDVVVIKRRLADGENHAALGAEFGVHRATIDDVAAGRSWKHV